MVQFKAKKYHMRIACQYFYVEEKHIFSMKKYALSQ